MTTRRILVVVVTALAAATAACGDKKMSAATCEYEAHRFGSWLKALPHHSPYEPTTKVLAVDKPLESAPASAAEAHSIAISARGVALRGELLAEPGDNFAGFDQDLAEALNRSNETRREMGLEEIYQVTLAIAPDAPWSLVAGTMSALAEVGQREQILVFEKKSAVRAAPKSKMSKRVEAIIADTEPARKATELAAVMQDLIKNCPALQRRFGEAAMLHPSGKEEFIRSETPKAIVECQCRIDLEASQTVFHAVLAPNMVTGLRTVRVGPGEYDEPDAGVTLALPGATPWSEAHAKVLEAADKPFLVLAVK